MAAAREACMRGGARTIHAVSPPLMQEAAGPCKLWNKSLLLNVVATPPTVHDIAAARLPEDLPLARKNYIFL